MILLYATIKNGLIIPNNKKEVFEMEGKEVMVKIEKKTHVRTDTQNRSLHLWLDMVSKELNGAGYNVQLVLKEVIDLEWTGELAKELLWRPIQKALIKKKSTTELDKVQEIDIVYDHINRYLAERFHIHVPFPNDPDKKKPAVTVENYPENNLEPKF
jgi:hypothetical protein